tara:strand:+ start:151 stop:501 length:351 start_codon:yes stop_codon:yes gene_type:complete
MKQHDQNSENKLTRINMTETKKKQILKPEHVVRNGAVAASIWKRQAPSGFEYFDFSITRSWKSKGTGREGYSPNFFARCKDDLLNTIEAATQWIDEQSDEPSKADSKSAETSHQLY